jgi:hypothetical protein
MNAKRSDHLRPPLSLIRASWLAAGVELRVGAPVHAKVRASRPRESTVRRNQIVRGAARQDNGADTERRAHRRCFVRDGADTAAADLLVMSNGYGESATGVSGAQARSLEVHSGRPQAGILKSCPNG